ncbi:MAG: TolC family protein [Planctomycetota bacterium]
MPRPVLAVRSRTTRVSGNLPPAAAIIAALVLSGCVAPMDRLDRDAAAMIEARQNQTLGPLAPDDPDTVPGQPIVVAGDALYEETPETQNLDPDQLPAVTDPELTIDTDRLPGSIGTDEGPLVSLDLEGVLATAIRTAPAYRREKEDLFLTTLSLIIERHLWGPRFFSGVSGRLNGTPESGDFDTVGTLVADLGVTQRLPYGGNVSIRALVDYVAFLQQSSTSTADEETQGGGLELSLNLPLLRGAGMVAREDLIQSERDLTYAIRAFERFRREFLVDLSSEYFGLVFAQQQIVNQQAQLRNLSFVAEQFRALADAGKIRGFQAENIEQDVLSARNRLLSLRESYANRIDRFKIDLGLDMGARLVIEPSEVQVPRPILELEPSVSTALDYRLDLQTAADRVIDARRRVSNARNNVLPDLDLDADLDLRTDDDKQRAGFDLELSDSSYDVGLNFELPLDRRIEYSNLRAAQVRLERDLRELDVFRDGITLEVRQAIREIEQSRFSLELQKRNVMLNERRALEVSLRRRSLGARDVIEAQEDLNSARDARDQAASDLQTSVLEYLLATGQLRVDPAGQWLPPALLVPLEIAQPQDTPADPNRDDLMRLELPPEAAPVIDAPAAE